jgi:hypothetical protein
MLSTVMSMAWILGETQRTSDQVHPFDPSDSKDHQDTAHVTANAYIPSHDRPTAATISDNTRVSRGNPTHLTDNTVELAAEEREDGLMHCYYSGRLPTHDQTPLLSLLLRVINTIGIHQPSTADKHNRRASRAGESLRRFDTEGKEGFWDKYDDSRNS